MSEEEKKIVEKFKKLYLKDFNHEKIMNEDRLSYLECALISNLIEKQQKELNRLKEIEQQHKTDNGLLRQELDMQIEHNKELKATLKQTQDSWFEDTQKLEQEKEKNKKLYEQNQIYLSNGSNIKLELHIKNNYIRKDKIQEKIKEYDGLKIIDKQAYEEQIKPLKELWEDNRFDGRLDWTSRIY